MRLLLLTTAPACDDRAGAIIHWLARRGHAVSAIAPAAPAASSNGLAELKIHRVPLTSGASAGGLGRRMQHISFAVACAPTLLGEAATFAPDVVGVLAPSASAASAALAAARLAGVPAWLHLEEDAPPLGVESAFACVSAAAYDAAERLGQRGVPADAALPLPPWVDLRTLASDAGASAVRASLGAEAGDVIALYAGWCCDPRAARAVIDASRLVPPKGAIRFVAACEGPAAQLFAREPGRPRLALPRLPAAKELGSLLAAADIHLLLEGPAFADPLIPAKLATLLASGRPVLAGPPRDGFVTTVDPVSGERLAERVVALAAAAEERRSLGLAARGAAADYFAMERVLRALERRLLALMRK